MTPAFYIKHYSSRTLQRWKSTLSWLVLIAALFGSSCGTEIGNPKKPDPKPVEGSIFLTDTTAATDLISSLFEDNIQSSTEASEPAAKLQLTGSNVQLPAFDLAPAMLMNAEQKRCLANPDGTVLVTRSFEGESTTEKTRKKHTLLFTKSGTDKINRIYKSNSSAITCNDTNTNINLGFSGLDGLEVSSTFDRSLTQTLSVKTTGRVLHNRRSTAQGNSSHTFQKLALPTSSPSEHIGIKVTTTRSSTKSHTIARRDGTTKDLTSSTGTIDGLPLVLEQIHRQSDANLVTRTIVSGTTFSEQAGDSRLEISYNNVTYTAAGGCIPVSGEISGIIKDLSVATPDARVTFTITFADQTPMSTNDESENIMVVFSTGEKTSFGSITCPIE